MNNISKKHWIYTAIGASNHNPLEREVDDYYATPPDTIVSLFGVQNFNKDIWEPSCGELHLSKKMQELGKNVLSTDIVDRGAGTDEVLDFLSYDAEKYKGMYDIITNPPFKYAQKFCEQAIDLAKRNVAMFMKLQFLESVARQDLFRVAPPTYVAVFIKRVTCAKNGKWESLKNGSPASYAWFIWDKEKLNPPIGINTNQPRPQILWV